MKVKRTFDILITTSHISSQAADLIAQLSFANNLLFCAPELQLETNLLNWVKQSFQFEKIEIFS